ncbi:fumarylacetoacetate hydrolase family protein [Marinivivus vitaminiproducens]|nr:fumarylacetoacetate hydrolase family protein [Geminicoccaceae bacterium SCSIO 64248]
MTDDGRMVVDLAASDPTLPADMLAFIRLGNMGLERARRALAADGVRIPIERLRILAPLPRPARNIFCVGKNYHEHAAEFHKSGFDASSARDGSGVPAHPIIFTKAPSSVIGPGVAIPRDLDPTDSVDYEGELAVVIGTGGRGIARADAFAHVYGYTIVNDVTARALQKRHAQWLLGKSIDGFCPMGPAIVTADSIGDVAALHLVTRVNDEVRQDARVADLIFDIPDLIETISRGITLEPGDVIATGTPVGVGIGFDPPRFLKQGDTVSITIDPLGTLTNPVN